MEPNSTNILDYESLIRDAAKERDNKPIPNSTDYHAFIAIKYLLNSANTNVRIVSSEFREIFWGNLFQDLSQFLSKEGTKIDIIVQKTGNNNLIDKLRETFGIKKVDARQSDVFKQLPDFLTTDSMGYRFETADDKKSLVQGVINFGDASGTASLNELFAKAQAKIAPYTP